VDPTGTEIERQDEFADTPQGWAERWTSEFAAAKKWIRDWHVEAKRTYNAYLREKPDHTTIDAGEKQRLSLYYANINTLKALLYGAPPQVQVKRRFGDPADDVARAAGETIQRLLNTDIEREDDGYTTALELCLLDRLLCGLGTARCRYVVEWETQTEPAIVRPNPVTGQPVEVAPEVTRDVKTFEDVEIDHVNWDDQLWSPCRRFHDMRWWAQRVYMTRDALVQRFGEELGQRVPLNAKGQDNDEGSAPPSPWNRAEVWEIWSKEHRRVWWFVQGFDQVLDSEDDPYRLPGFWPFPRFFASNLTTKKLVPKPDYEIARELYEDCDVLCRRIALLEDAIKVAGAYDASCSELQSLLSRSGENFMVPVDNWAAFAERGGIQGAVSWFPLEIVVGAVDKLSQKLVEKMNLLYQVTGMSDIMRGAAQSGATATEQAIKARFAGVRVESFQQQFAVYASAVQAIKYQMICNLFDPKTIIERSNIMATQDAPMAQQVTEFLKARGKEYRIRVDPDSVSLADMTALKQERTEFLTAFSGMMQAIAPLMQIPGGMEFGLEVMKWVTASLKGSSGIEAAMDKAIEAVKKAEQQKQAQGPKPDPKIALEKERQEGALEREGLKAQTGLALADKNIQGKVIEQQAQAAFMPRPFHMAPVGPGVSGGEP
jgi:hypothetical protein